MKRKALGKGLRSLIPEAPPTAAKLPEASAAAEAAVASKKDGLRNLDIDRISPNRQQPRQEPGGGSATKSAAHHHQPGCC